MPMYLQVTLQLKPTYIAIIPMVMYMSGIFVAVIMKIVTKLVGQKVVFGIACFVGGAGSLWLHWGKESSTHYIIDLLVKIQHLIICLCPIVLQFMLLGHEDDSEFTDFKIYIIAVLMGLGGAAMLITSLSITAELIGDNKESSVFVYGAMSLVYKVSNGEYCTFLTHYP